MVEDDIIHPHDAMHGARRTSAQVAGRWAPHRRVTDQAQRDAVQRAAGRGLAEVSDRPTGQAPVEEEAAQCFVTGLAAGAGIAPDVQAPAEHEHGLRAVRARRGLDRPVGSDHGGGRSFWKNAYARMRTHAYAYVRVHILINVKTDGLQYYLWL
jgi:hypothetical protein